MRKGFTLVEMMIVMMAIALLFLLTIPNIARTVTVIETSGCKSQVSLIDTAILQYKLEKQRYPESLDDLIKAGFLIEEQRYCQNGKEISIEGNQAKIR
ncbi:MAG: competence protein ComGC [Firmicutes bacterium HGW-Firmicutes-20]|jgi:competence protein ComGC|nr:MAG: competence protein ComGC [Firmicutes bacterium HGW-Firmicutes-20]PKM69418.1 MAG: competence protein ComGC [Firmicutes bacterium HGW-Firmicutes-19]